MVINKNMIKIDNKKIYNLLLEKDKIVKEGRGISAQIETIESKIATLDKKERAITEKVNPKDLIERGDALKDEINNKIKELEKIAKEIEDVKIKAIPEDMVKEHYALRAEKEKKERERNKLALKVQKIKDKVIPLIQKEMKSHLNDYEDIETAKIMGDKVVIETFSHLEEWKKQFDKRKLAGKV